MTGAHSCLLLCSNSKPGFIFLKTPVLISLNATQNWYFSFQVLLNATSCRRVAFYKVFVLVETNQELDTSQTWERSSLQSFSQSQKTKMLPPTGFYRDNLKTVLLGRPHLEHMWRHPIKNRQKRGQTCPTSCSFWPVSQKNGDSTALFSILLFSSYRNRRGAGTKRMKHLCSLSFQNSLFG